MENGLPGMPLMRRRAIVDYATDSGVETLVPGCTHSNVKTTLDHLKFIRCEWRVQSIVLCKGLHVVFRYDEHGHLLL